MKIEINCDCCGPLPSDSKLRLNSPSGQVYSCPNCGLLTAPISPQLANAMDYAQAQAVKRRRRRLRGRWRQLAYAAGVALIAWAKSD